jgi:hypothetical protein
MLKRTMTLKPTVTRSQQITQGLGGASQQVCARKPGFLEQTSLLQLSLHFATFQLDQSLLQVKVVHGVSPFSKAGII